MWIVEEEDIARVRASLRALNEVARDQVHTHRVVTSVVSIDNDNHILTMKILFHIYHLKFDAKHTHIYDRIISELMYTMVLARTILVEERAAFIDHYERFKWSQRKMAPSARSIIHNSNGSRIMAKTVWVDVLLNLIGDKYREEIGKTKAKLPKKLKQGTILQKTSTIITGHIFHDLTTR